MKYLQSTASKFVHGEKPTNNPTMAARFILQSFKGGRSLREYRRLPGKRRSSYKGNPAPAVVAALGSVLGKLGGRFKSPSEKRARKVIPAMVQSALAGNLTAARAIMERVTVAGIEKERAEWRKALAQLPATVIAQVNANTERIPRVDHSSPEAAAASALASPVQVGTGAAPVGASPGTAASILQQLAQPGTIRTIAQAAKPRRSRSTRQRYPTYTDQYGRQRYSYKPPGSELRIPQGAQVSPGTPYSFFRGAIGKGGAGATAGQLAVAGAAGVAAYLVTQRLLQYLGGRAQGKEEAGVLAARALHEGLEDYKKQFGKYPPPAERAEMKRAYQLKLAELGYDPVTFTRSRSRVEQFLETYNPLD